MPDYISLQQLETNLNNAKSGGALTLNKSLITPTGAANIIQFLTTLPGNNLPLDHVSLALSGGALIISGQVTTAWAIPGLTGEELQGIAINLTFTAAAVNAPLIAVLKIAEARLHVQSDILMQGDLGSDAILLLYLKGNGSVNLSLAEIGKFISNDHLKEDLPLGESLFEALQLTDFKIDFSFDQKTHTKISATGEFSGEWEFVSGLPTLKNVGITISSDYNPVGSVYTVGGIIRATIHIGQDFDIIVPLQCRGLWELEVIPHTGNILPGLSELTNFAGGANLQNAVQNGLKTIGLGEISIDGVRFGFDFVKKKISCLALASHIVVHGVRINLHTTLLPEFQFGGSMSYDSRITLKTLASYYHTQTADIPEITVTEFIFFAFPSGGYYTIHTRFEDLWQFQVGDKVLALESVELSLTKSSQGVSGSLIGFMSFAATRFFIKAEPPAPDQGWQLEAMAGPIDLGNLVNDLGHYFGAAQLDTLNGLTTDILKLSFNTQSKDFSFECDGELLLGQPKLEAKINIDIKRQTDNTFDKSFSGKLTLRPDVQNALDFLLRFDTKPGAKNFIAAYHDENGMAVSIDALIQKVFDLETHTGLSFTLKDALFAYQSNGTSKYLFGLDIEGGLNLAELKLPDLPLVGAIFPADQTLKLAFQVLAPSAPFNAQELAALSALNSGGLAFPNQDLNNVTLATTLRMGNESKLLNLPIDLGKSGNGLAQASNPQTNAAQPSAASGTSNDGVQWLNVQKTFGPVQVQRIGLKYADSKITGLIDAALSVGGLTISLDGLSVTSALQPLHPEFALHGLGIDYRNGPLEIGGSFLKDTFQDEHGVAYTAYAGMAIVRTATLSLSAIGAYAKKDGQASLFIYAVLNTPLGGPAFFFVTGLAAGFGYNRDLRRPTVDQVANFPLVAEAVQGSAAAVPSDPAQRRNTLSTELRKLNDFIPPSVGENFLAVGLRFTSFELLDTFAVLIVKFGARFEIDILGLSTLIVPTAAAGNAVSPLAEAQLAIMAAFIPSEGFLGVQGQLTANSFVLARACHLTGGFAFFSWFDGPHVGDFVITLGGYHSKFQAPSHYPTVPRLGLNWQVNDNLSIKAQGYYALCPHAMMAGGLLEAMWRSDNVVAYFKAGADFLIAWQPYHYDIELYVTMAAEVIIHFFGTHHLSFDAGADLHLWGPEFAGEAHIYVKVLGFKVSFDVEFGAGASLPEPIDWVTFKKSFLPKPETVCSIAISRGLLKESEDGRWIINPKDFVLITNSALPATAANGDVTGTNTRLAVMPMGIRGGELSSSHQITITREEDAAKTNLIGTDFALSPVKKAVPAAMWGEPKLASQHGKTYLQPADLNGPRFVENTLAGFEVRCGKTLAPSETHWIDPATLRDAAELVDDAFSWQAFASTDAQGHEAWQAASNTILHNAKRADLLTALGLHTAEFDFGESLFDEVWVED